MEIKFIERKSKVEVTEIVAGDKILRWTYDTKAGRFILETIMKKKFFTKLSGWVMDTKYSKRRIAKFVKDLEIDLSEAQHEEIDNYKNFNDFFARQLKPGARPICQEEEILIAPADGRVLAYENIDIDEILQVKGSYFKLKEFIADEELAKEYEGGVCIVVRLAPADYHRFHFPTEGIPNASRKIKGDYYSVSPYALRKIVGIYCKNQREITEFESHHFGKLLLVEVGATCVGSIVQTYTANKAVSKGYEKGYFKFGGSTTIIFAKKDFLKVDEDIVRNTQNGLETKVNMGESLGKRL